MTQNVQDMILGVYHGHPCRQGWPCPPSLASGTLNILQVPPFLTSPPPSWHTSNKDIATKFSGYLSGSRIWSSMTSRMTMSSKYLIRNPQRPLSPPFLTPPYLTHFQWRYQPEIFKLSSWGQNMILHAIKDGLMPSKSPVWNPQCPPRPPTVLKWVVFYLICTFVCDK